MRSTSADNAASLLRDTRVLIVDDDPALTSLVSVHLEQWQLATETAHDQEQMWRALERQPHLVLLDVFLGPSDGSRLVADVHRRYPALPILMVTRSSDLEVAVRSMRNGARDYILKPIDFEKLERAVRDALEWRSLQTDLAESSRPSPTEVPEKDAASPAETGSMGAIIGESAAIQRLREIIGRVAPTNVPVLILGETGTGKELAARAIHQQSNRSDGPFVAVNAAAVPHELIESELFGHEKGAFTGANERKIGFCERAHGGTLFLDEIGEMAPSVQSKLLRFLQDHEVQRVGAQKARVVDVRVVAATNVDPRAQIDSGRLREDLYYRLRGVQIQLPPLRERGDDIRLLTEHFLANANRAEKRDVSCSAEALQALSDARWPGNVRQLENILREAVILSRSDRIHVDDLPADVLTGASGIGPVPAEQPIGPLDASAAATAPPLVLSDKQREERRQIDDGLQQGQTPEELAETLGVSRATLYRRMKKYRLSRPR